MLHRSLSSYDFQAQSKAPERLKKQPGITSFWFRWTSDARPGLNVHFAAHRGKITTSEFGRLVAFV